MKKVLLIIGGILLLIIVIGAASGDESATDTNNNGDANTETGSDESAETASLGDAVRDGSFEFTVNGLECGVEAVSDEFSETAAQGQFCLLDVDVENIGDSAQMLSASDQYLLDEEGREFSADSTATMTHNEDSVGFFLNEINPGNSVNGQIVFDVAEGAEVVQARLHDSAFSGGVEVNF